MLRLRRCYDHGIVTERAWRRRHARCYSPEQTERCWGDGIMRAEEFAVIIPIPDRLMPAGTNEMRGSPWIADTMFSALPYPPLLKFAPPVTWLFDDLGEAD